MHLLAVLGTRQTRAERVLDILDFHRASGRFWTPRPVLEGRIEEGTPVVAKVAGVSELWMTGALRSGEATRDPHPRNPARWPFAYSVAWDEPAPFGVPADEVLGARGKYAQTLISLTPAEFARARRALYG